MIDKGKLLEYIRELESSGSDSISFEDLKRFISGQPITGEWVECTGNITPDGEVLCCDIHGKQIVGCIVKDGVSSTGFSAESEEKYMFDCIAWQRLPERYRLEQ